MITKPMWQDLPWAVVLRLLENVELDYCPYESSRAQAIDDLKNDVDSVGDYKINKKLLEHYYKGMSEADLEVLIRQEMASALSVLETYKYILKE